MIAGAAQDPILAMIGAMEAAGVRPVEPIAHRLSGGALVRFRCEGDKPSRRNGWAILYLDAKPAGAFGNYRLAIRKTWRTGASDGLTPNEQAALRREIAAAAEARRIDEINRHRLAAQTASAMLARSTPPGRAHPYLVRKEMTGEGLRQLGDMLLVPMRDPAGQLWNVQRIAPDGVKLFLRGGRTAGLAWRCGEPAALICIGEGVSTMAAVRRATGHAVIASFSEKNLLAVAQAVHARWPDLDKVICADDDAHLIDHPTIARNVGLDAARGAALAIGGRLATPPRGDGT